MFPYRRAPAVVPTVQMRIRELIKPPETQNAERLGMLCAAFEAYNRGAGAKEAKEAKECGPSLEGGEKGGEKGELKP